MTAALHQLSISLLCVCWRVWLLLFIWFIHFYLFLEGKLQSSQPWIHSRHKSSCVCATETKGEYNIFKGWLCFELPPKKLKLAWPLKNPPAQPKSVFAADWLDNFRGGFQKPREKGKHVWWTFTNCKNSLEQEMKSLPLCLNMHIGKVQSLNCF